jgi:hypothetical protein
MASRDFIRRAKGVMVKNSAPSTPTSARLPLQAGLILLICAHILVCCVSLIYAADSFPGIVPFDNSKILYAISLASGFAFVALLFATSQFSFGYILGFYFYTMILGYLWLVEFSLLSYNHDLAIISISLSAVAFLAPALLVTSPIKRRFEFTVKSFNALSSSILILAAGTVAIGAAYDFKPVGLSEMYKFRAQIEFPTLLTYAVGMTTSALLPFVFACFVARKSYWRAGIVLLLLLLLYPVTLTKLTLSAPFWLLFLVLLSTLVETRTAVILSLFLPTIVGVFLLSLTKIGAFPRNLETWYFSTVNFRMIAIPSIALEVYNDFFASHPLTHFCQINLLKPVLACPYDEELSVLMSKAYRLGAFNASLFATEGIASVGLVLAPLSALGCGLVIAFANRLSSGLPANFILLSSGMLPQVFLNVPLSTNLLTNGAAVLFLLWFVTPRAWFEKDGAEAASAQKEQTTASSGSMSTGSTMPIHSALRR